MNAQPEIEIRPQTEQPDTDQPFADQQRARVPLPRELESSGCKLAYLYLRIVDEASIEELRDALGLQTISLYPILEVLEGEGLVERDGERYVCTVP